MKYFTQFENANQMLMKYVVLSKIAWYGKINTETKKARI